MSGRIVAIGDIHGCSAALDAILDAVSPTADDTIVALGDYVDRGPNSKAVIDRLIALRQHCNLVALHGNHEEMMLNVVKEEQSPFHWLQHGGVQTLDSYMFAGDMSVIPPEHHQFFDQMVDYYETEEHFFVHANYDPELQLSEQDREHLRWIKLTDVTPQPHVSGKRAVVGHTHDRGGEIFDIGHLICIDTYCYGGGWLTALDVDSGQMWQADQEGTMRQQG